MAGLRPLSPLDSKVVRMAGYGQVYFIGHEDDGLEAPVKIGVTGNLAKRMQSLKTSTWRKLILHDVIYVKTWMDVADERSVKSAMQAFDDDAETKALAECDLNLVSAWDVEKSIHERCKAAGLHHSREWFNGGVDRLTAAINYSAGDATLAVIPRAIHVNVDGTAVVRLEDAAADSTLVLNAGQVYPYRVKIVRNSGTTASMGIYACY